MTVAKIVPIVIFEGGDVMPIGKGGTYTNTMLRKEGIEVITLLAQSWAVAVAAVIA